MGKNKRKKSTIIIDGVEYKVIQWTNKRDTNLKYVPQNSPGVFGSGLHISEKNKKEIHWDYYNGNKKVEGMKKYVEEPPKFSPMAIINFKEHFAFPIPPNNQIVVFKGRDKSMDFISLEYYEKNKEYYLSKYFVKVGTEDNPQVLELK